MVENLLEGLPREQRECFGYDLDGTAAFTTCFNIDVA
jgi:hypothetical protein